MKKAPGVHLRIFVLTESKYRNACDRSFLIYMSIFLTIQFLLRDGLSRAPLSEGRVEEDGSLLCSYHGWRWEGDGNLAAVPHTDSKSELQRIIDNPKSSCNAFPTKVKGGLLYVWPASGSDA